jgi:siroheme synthase-like protein
MKALTYPVSLSLEGRRCLLVGDGPELLRRAGDLLAAGAVLHVVSPTPPPELRELARAERLELSERVFAASDLDGCWLSILVGRDPELVGLVGRAATAARVFHCAVDAPAHNGFSHLALARAGALTLAVGTGGEAPALARKLRDELRRLLDESHVARFVERVAELRRRTPSAERQTLMSEAVAGVEIDGVLRVPEPPGAALNREE